jgi:hypothetical protein
VLADFLDRRLGFLTILQIWRDQFLGVSLTFVVIHGGAGGWDEVDSPERGC